MSQRKITLLLPGYAPDSPPYADHAPEVHAGLPSTNHQSGEFALANHQAPDNVKFSEDLERHPWQAQLAQLTGLETAGGKRLPGARLGLPGTQVEHIVRADPISLKADRDSATLIRPEQLALTVEESTLMIEALNEFVAEDGLLFFSQHPHEWYMSGMSAEALESYPPSFLANRNASTFLPDGDGAAPWRRLMTEVQMLLHSHPVNQRREQRGLMPVNSVWFWGGAPLQQPSVDAIPLVIYADENEVQSLAKHVGLTCLPLAQFSSDISNDVVDEACVVVDLSIVQAWLNADVQQLDHELARIHEQWLQPLSRLVGTGQLEQFRILTEDGLQGVCNAHTQFPASGNSTGWVKRIRQLFNR